MALRTRRGFLRGTLPAAAVLLAGCPDQVYIGDPALVHRLEPAQFGVSRVDGGWHLQMELGWELEQEGMMSGVGLAGPAIAVFDADRDLVERRPIDLPLAAYEDCEYAGRRSDGDDEERDDDMTVVRDGQGAAGPDRTTKTRNDATAVTTTCPLRMPVIDETTGTALTVERFPYLISFAFDRVETEIDVVVYEYAGPPPPPETLWEVYWVPHVLEYPRESDSAPLP